MPSIRVLIVDDAPAWRQCVRLMLEEHSTFQVVGEASDGLEAIQKSQQLQPDVILLDVCLPILNGIEAAAQNSPGKYYAFHWDHGTTISPQLQRAGLHS